jgi:hypothetical protein
MNACQGPKEQVFPLYQCHKQVRAVMIDGIEPMIHGEGKVLVFKDGQRKHVDNAWLARNPALAAGGYFIEYQEGDKYTSYSPAYPFENGYTLIRPPHQERVVTEKAELDEKLAKLKVFITEGDMFSRLPADERDRLQDQADIMTNYSCILGDRIAAF